MPLPKNIEDFKLYEDYTHMKHCTRCDSRRKLMLYTAPATVDRLVKCDPNMSDAQAFDEWVHELERTEQVEILRLYSFCPTCKNRNLISYDSEGITQERYELYKISKYGHIYNGKHTQKRNRSKNG
ncbi:hypothetical protein [Leclercia adecarboxylata]|uniref:hypothetical protein n=1 Tax=Leclercia adecarboxylata TaxID=83655 RepID=UPI001F36C378|nr:hypothetical protein [Leclercia adecarboxylata]MCE9980758.1 hypothetical protein [Leclercia adecarboxylata]